MHAGATSGGPQWPISGLIGQIKAKIEMTVLEEVLAWLKFRRTIGFARSRRNGSRYTKCYRTSSARVQDGSRYYRLDRMTGPILSIPVMSKLLDVIGQTLDWFSYS